MGLARAREAAGLTQEAFAVLAGVEVSTVVRWESGDTTPLPGKRTRIARVLGVSLPELERLLSPDGSQVLSGVRVFAGNAAPEPGGLTAIAAVRESVAKLAAEYRARPARGHLVQAAALLERVEALSGAGSGFDVRTGFDEPSAPTGQTAPTGFEARSGGAAGAAGARFSGQWRRDLDIAEAEAALLTGRVLWDAAGRRDAAAVEELFDLAARRAARAGDGVLQASAVLRAAFPGLYGGDPRAGVRRCVQAAVVAAPVSPALVALARLHAAEGHAMLGHAVECDRALVAAGAAAAAIDADDPAQGACPPRARLRLTGAAHLALGRHAEARAVLTDAAARHAPGKALALVLGHLSEACLGEGDVDAAVRHLRSAFEMVEATCSAGALAVVFRAGRDIVRVSGRSRPDVAEIVDQLLAIGAAG